MGMHSGFFGAGVVTVVRQISAVIAPLTAMWSVDVSGVVQ
jgi:hypothetical protein